MKPKTKERVLFCQFLKENGITKEFVKEFNRQRGNKGLSNTVLGVEIGTYYVNSSFSWYDTTQGSNFWMDIDSKWHDYLNQHNN